MRIPFVGFLVTFAVFIALALIFVLHGVLNADEGFYLAASHLVSQGYRLYHDFGYTQGPLFPYLDLPWLELFGHTLAGQRLAGLAWTLLTVLTGAFWLKRTHSWPTATLYVVLLLGAPLWLAFAVKGKTYAFAGLAVLTGAIALLAAWPTWLKWAVFIVAAAGGTGARLPMAGFFAPAFVGLLIFTPSWWGRFLGAALTMFCAVVIMWLTAGADWDRFIFWTMSFHRDSSFYIPIWTHFVDCLRFAPVLWMVTVMSGLSLRPRVAGADSSERNLDGVPFPIVRLNNRKNTTPRRVVLVAIAIALVSNLSASTTYAEYIFPFIPVGAFMAAPFATDLVVRFSMLWRVVFVFAAIAAGWNYPPEFSPNLLVHAGQAEAFLRENVAPGAVVAASMPEIPIAAGAQLPLAMAMGKFGITEDFDAAIARGRRMLTPVTLQDILTNPDTKAFVGSPSYNWNFFWSLPSYHVLSPGARKDIYATLRANYRLEFMNEEYVIYLRRTETAK